MGASTAGSSKEQRLSRLRAGATAQLWRPASARRATQMHAQPHLWRGLAQFAAAAREVKGDSFDVNTSVKLQRCVVPRRKPYSGAMPPEHYSSQPKSPRRRGCATHSVVRARTMPFRR